MSSFAGTYPRVHFRPMRAQDAAIHSGGPAGCVVAGRLAYADPTLKVMLIECRTQRATDCDCANVCTISWREQQG